MFKDSTFPDPDPNRDVFTMAKLEMSLEEIRRAQPARYLVVPNIDQSIFIPGAWHGIKTWREVTPFGTTEHVKGEHRQDTYYITINDALRLEQEHPELAKELEWQCEKPEVKECHNETP